MPSAISFPDFTGSMIADGLYRFVEKLGSGSFGVVYLAVDELTHGPSKPQYYAIKCIPRYAPGSRRDRLQAREFLTQQRVQKHHNILKIHDIYSDEEFNYVILDLCPGGDLCNAVLNGAFVDNDELIKTIFIQILDAVEYCHKKCVAHRDLKPENILLNEGLSQVYLADFGLATFEMQSGDFRTGTKAYMSPECLNGTREEHKTYDTRASDVWSLGIILIGMISCAAPWTKASKGDTFYSDFLSNASFLQERLKISPAAADLLESILQADPRNRPSISDIRDQVRSINTFSAAQEPPRDLEPFSSTLVCEQMDDIRLGSSGSIRSEDITALLLSPCLNPIKIRVVGSREDSGLSRDENLLIITRKFPMPPAAPRLGGGSFGLGLGFGF